MNKSKLNYKTSYGIALCRRGKNNCIEVLSIKKRFTYSYSSFIYGYWNTNRNESKINAYVKYLFDNMTFQEKLLILSMNFGNMWWHMWLNNPEKGIGMFDNNNQNSDTVMQSVNDYKNYFNKKNKFEKKFMHDKGRHLKQIINGSKSCDTIWEIPKGTGERGETELDTAIREFTEETLIDPKYYDILYHVKPAICTYKDNKTVYKHIYYIANLNDLGYNTPSIMSPKVNFSSQSQVSEVADMQWLSVQYIKSIKIPTKAKKNMIKLYQDVISNRSKRYPSI